MPKLCGELLGEVGGGHRKRVRDRLESGLDVGRDDRDEGDGVFEAHGEVLERHFAEGRRNWCLVVVVLGKLFGFGGAERVQLWMQVMWLSDEEKQVGELNYVD